MNKLSTMVDKMFVAVAIILHSTLYTLHLSASPTANEDFVVAEDAKTYTNAVNTAVSNAVAQAKAYTDGAISSAGGVTPEMVTNIVNAVAPTPGDYANVSNAAMNAATSAEVDSSIDAFRERLTTGEVWPMWADMANWASEADVAYMLGYFGSSDDPEYFSPRYGQHIVWQLDAATATNAAQSSQLNTIGSQVATIGAHLNAEDARFVVTNYNSVTHTPEAYVEIKLPDESWSRIWSEMTRWNYLFDTYLPTNYYTKAAVDAVLDDKADRAWGFYDSTTGAYAPDGYTWISSSKIAIAANLAYQRTITSEGAIWVLESNGTVSETGGTTNGFFRISDDEGNSLFEIVKGNKRTIGADASSCVIVSGFTPTKLRIGYSVVSDVHPTIQVCETLAAPDWKSEDDANCIANVSWSGESGAWVAEVQGKSAHSSMFVKASYETGGETMIRNEVPVEMSTIMLNGTKYYLGTATIDGKTVLTLSTTP